MSKIYTLDEYQKAGNDLYEKLHLVSHPVAVRYIKELSEVPPGVKKPSDQGTQMSPCQLLTCLLYTSPSPRDRQKSRMPSSA